MEDPRLHEPLTLVIFGITGDLAQRKLLPALYQLAKAQELPEQLRIIGVSRRDVSKDDVFSRLKSFVGEQDFDGGVEQHLRESTEMRQMDLLAQSDYESLLTRLQEIESAAGSNIRRLYYLSIPSQAFTPIIRLLGQTGHNAPLAGGEMPRLLIEKPFGYDLESARELIAVLAEHFSEEQVYRIDHYVAKETVQNILTFRFHNPLFESIWNNHHIDHISIVAHEKLDIEGRAAFYEQTGALRDLIQSHLLQLLAIITMSRPSQLESSQIHEAKLRLLQSVEPIPSDKVVACAKRGQYEGYRTEVNNSGSFIETFARLQLYINDEQWQGVPVVLETGKALAEKLTEISVCFKPSPYGQLEENKLVFRIQPQEGITLRLQVKQPGISNITSGADMTFDYAKSFNQRPAEAYERVIVDAIRADQTLFASSAEVIRSWEIVQNVLAQWAWDNNTLQFYPKGSAGPVEK
ncbi:MAG TPA: glucose-6-phosphate dehydrogenase [Candidatus Saccharimonadales bacterium]|nr:glucose-6-phosphate dehydrogenase [Candidatus Saccharimonadales bacterium]